jgi:CubicO group peptidase (beta-lactamase class C family)
VKKILFLNIVISCYFTSCANIPVREKYEDSVTKLEVGKDIATVVDELANPLIENENCLGMSVGIVTPYGTKVFNYGVQDVANKKTINQNSIFQVGSITKVITTSLLVSLEQDNYLKVSGPIGTAMPDSFKPDNKWMREMSFASLATHTSGLPQEKKTIGMLFKIIKFLFTGQNIWAGFSEDEMWEFLTDYGIEKDDYGLYSYSNVGMVLLGNLLNRVVENKDYHTLVKEYITGPLSMDNTFFEANDDQLEFIVPGHAGQAPPFVFRGSNIKPWKLHRGLHGAGSAYSSMKDLMSFLKVHMGLTKSKYYNAYKKAHTPIVKTPKGHVGLGWFTEELPKSKTKYTYHGGIIAGHTSFIGFDEDSKVGIVVLQNSLNFDDHVGVTLLDRIIGAYKSSSNFKIKGIDTKI